MGCSSNFLGIKSFVSEKRLPLQLYTTSTLPRQATWQYYERLTGLVTGTCNECVLVAKKASLHDWVLRSNVSQTAIQLLRDSACTG